VVREEECIKDMPTYEYECNACQIRFEKFQSILSEPLERCPTCNGEAKRLIGAGSGIIYKGSGFFATDYRSSEYKEKKEKESKEKKD
jgi:putative FmdB family regulatory protein